MENVLFSQRQYIMLLVSSITVTGHLIIVSIVFDIAGRDSWLSLPIAIIPGFFLMYILAELSRANPKQSLVEMLVKFFGTFLGKMIALIYLGYFFLPPAITLRLLMDFMTIAFMPETPPSAFSFVFALICAYSLFNGLENFLRINEFFLPFLIFGGILASVISFPFKEFSRLLPLIENGFNPVLLGSIPLIGLICELIVIAMIHQNINKQTQIFRLNLTALFIIGFLFIGPLTGPIVIFGPEMASVFTYPTFSQISYIYLPFWENFEPVAIFLWIAGIFGKITIFYYAIILGLTQITGYNNFKLFIIPVGVIILLISFYAFPNSLVLENFIKGPYTIISIILGLALPFLLLIFSKIKRLDRK